MADTKPISFTFVTCAICGSPKNLFTIWQGMKMIWQVCEDCARKNYHPEFDRWYNS